jgi:hypothetical protein
MAVMMPRQQWTDERLDHFEKRVEERFDQIDERLDRMDADIRELRVAVMGVQRVMLQGFIAICTVMVAGFTAIAGGIG